MEEDLRRTIFEKNIGIIRGVNAEFDSGQSSYDLRVNCFGDLELEEFARDYLGLGVLSKDLLRKENFIQKNSFFCRGRWRSTSW